MDNESFIQIYNELKVSVFTVSYRIVQSRELAEDITQDVFVKLFTLPPDSSVRNIRAWIFRIARNLCIDALRKKQSIDIDELQIADSQDIQDVASSLDLETAIGSLPVEEREILSLHLNCDLGFKEISDICNMPMTTVYRKYRKALNALKKLLCEMDGGSI